MATAYAASTLEVLTAGQARVPQAPVWPVLLALHFALHCALHCALQDKS